MYSDVHFKNNGKLKLLHGKVLVARQQCNDEILYSTLVFKEIIYLCKRVDNRIVRVARPRIRFKNKQSTAII